MRHSILVWLVAIGIFAFGGRLARAQESSPSPGGGFVGMKSPKEPAFVPGEVIVKMKPEAGIKAVAPSKLSVEPAPLEVAVEQAKLQYVAPSKLSVEPAPRRLSGGAVLYRIKLPDAARRIKTSVVADRGQAKLREQTLALVNAFRKRPDVEYAQPNYLMRLADVTPNDPYFGKQWHYFNNGTGTGESPGGISLPRAWSANTGSGTIVVAVLDTGILPDHEDIVGGGNLVDGYDMITDWWRANDGDPPVDLNDPRGPGSSRDRDPTDAGDMTTECEEPALRKTSNTWHGTHVAGIVGVGSTNNGIGIAGGNWRVKVQTVRVMGLCGADSVDVADGIRWAVGLSIPSDGSTMIPLNPTPAKVINLSMTMDGTCLGPNPVNPLVRDAIRDAIGQRAVVVTAAGNDTKDVSESTPGSCDGVISVAASDHLGHLAYYSNFGDRIDIMAPGGDKRASDSNGVYSMVKKDRDHADWYFPYEGTSMAAPHVAGVAALLLARDATLTPTLLLAKLKAMALSRTPGECPNPCGAGLLQASEKFWRQPRPQWAIIWAIIIMVIIIAMALIKRKWRRPTSPPPYG